MIPVTQIKTLFVRFHKEFLGKIVNLKIGDCSESTSNPSIISAPSVNSEDDSLGVGIEIFGSEGKKSAKKFILIMIRECIPT